MPTQVDVTPERIAEILHELRAPLGGIDAMIEMLGGTDLRPDQAKIVGALAAASAHLRAVANEVLAPGSEAAPALMPLGELVTGIAIAAEARARGRGLVFILRGPTGEQADIAVEAGPLRQVIENLIDNAMRLAGRGAITLAIEPEEAGRFRVSVTDEGPGITKVQAARLIREGGALAGRASGAGLGLRIAGGLVAERGGRLDGGPAPEGRGARFAFDWPVAMIGASRPAQCLIVDDHPAARRVLMTILEAAGYACMETGRVDEALALIERVGPALVLTDLAMPDGGGRTLIERIAALPAQERPAIVVVSADSIAKTDPLRPMIAGSIEKPIAVRTVLGIVGDLIPAAPSRAA
jgi:CheY-like chemotaxis protein